MTKLTLRYLILIIWAVIALQAPIGSFCVDNLLMAGGFAYPMYQYPQNLGEVEGKILNDIVIKTNGYTDPEYFKVFLVSKKGQSFSLYNIRRDINMIQYLTRCEIQTQIVTNGNRIILYYYIKETEHQGLLYAGISGNNIGFNVESWNYNRTGSKYKLSVSCDSNGVKFRPDISIISSDGIRFGIDHYSSNGYGGTNITISNFTDTLSLGYVANYPEEYYDSRITYSRKFINGASEITIIQDYGIQYSQFGVQQIFEPWVYIPFWKHILEYKTSTIDNLPMTVRGYSIFDWDIEQSKYQLKDTEEFYLPLRLDRILLYGGFLEYGVHNSMAYGSIGTGIKLNVFPLGKCMNVSIALPLVTYDQQSKWVFNITTEDLFK